MTRSLLASLLLVTAGLALALGVGTPDPGAAERAYAGAAALLIIVAVYRSLARSRDAGSLEVRGALRNENARSTEGEEARDGATSRRATSTCGLGPAWRLSPVRAPDD